MVRWLRWHCPPDTGFEIRTLAVWGRARYLSVTEAPHNTDFHTWMGKKHFCFFQTAETGNRAPDSGVKGSGANHYPRAPALLTCKITASGMYLLPMQMRIINTRYLLRHLWCSKCLCYMYIAYTVIMMHISASRVLLDIFYMGSHDNRSL